MFQSLSAIATRFGLLGAVTAEDTLHEGSQFVQTAAPPEQLTAFQQPLQPLASPLRQRGTLPDHMTLHQAAQHMGTRQWLGTNAQLSRAITRVRLGRSAGLDEDQSRVLILQEVERIFTKCFPSHDITALGTDPLRMSIAEFTGQPLMDTLSKANEGANWFFNILAQRLSKFEVGIVNSSLSFLTSSLMRYAADLASVLLILVLPTIFHSVEPGHWFNLQHVINFIVSMSIGICFTLAFNGTSCFENTALLNHLIRSCEKHFGDSHRLTRALQSFQRVISQREFSTEEVSQFSRVQVIVRNGILGFLRKTAVGHDQPIPSLRRLRKQLMRDQRKLLRALSRIVPSLPGPSELSEQLLRHSSQTVRHLARAIPPDQGRALTMLYDFMFNSTWSATLALAFVGFDASQVSWANAFSKSLVLTLLRIIANSILAAEKSFSERTINAIRAVYGISGGMIVTGLCSAEGLPEAIRAPLQFLLGSAMIFHALKLTAPRMDQTIENHALYLKVQPK